MTTNQSASPAVSATLALEHALRYVRHQSLIAARNNDFRKVAALTAEAKRLNDQLSKDPKNAH